MDMGVVGQERQFLVHATERKVRLANVFSPWCVLGETISTVLDKERTEGRKAKTLDSLNFINLAISVERIRLRYLRNLIYKCSYRGYRRIFVYPRTRVCHIFFHS